jgi:hypothetical protein
MDLLRVRRRLKLQVSRQFGPEQVEQRRVHEAEVIGNAQRDDLLTRGFLREAFADPVGVFFLHAENQIGPADVSGRELDAGAVLGARRTRVIAGMTLEEGFRGRRSPLIGGANEEELGFQARKRPVGDRPSFR